MFLLRISRRVRICMGGFLLLVMLIHFQSFLFVSNKLKHLDFFQVDNLGRDRQWKAQENRAKRTSTRENVTSQRQAKESKPAAKHQMEDKNVHANASKYAANDEVKDKVKAKEFKDGARHHTEDNGKPKDSKGQEQGQTAEATEFYQSHYKSLFNTSLDNLLVWKIADDGGDTTSAFSRLWEILDYYQSPDKEENIPFNVSHFLRIDDSICRVAMAFNEHMRRGNAPLFLPQVVLLRLDDNMGGFSAVVDTKTGLPDGRDLSRHWNDEGCKEARVFAYLAHPNTRAIFTTQYQVYDYPKVHSIALGLRSHKVGRKILHRIKTLKGHMIRTQLLLVDDPTASTQNVVEKFRKQGCKVQSTYGTSVQNYLDKMTSSKFFLSPGVDDSFQIWEALFSGCIPIIQHFNRQDGWFRTFDGLPVAWIDSFENLTPQWLEEEYQKLTKTNSYKWEKLTQQWWVDFIRSFAPEQGRNSAQKTYPRMESSAGTKLSPSFSKDNGSKNEQQSAGQVQEASNRNKEFEKIFYDRHYESLHNVSVDDMIVWETRKSVNGSNFSRFWEHFDYYQPAPNLENFPFNISHFIRVDYNICQVALAFNEDLKQSGAIRLPHVVLFRLDEEMGGFSAPVDRTGTTSGRGLMDQWGRHGCKEARIFQYLTHPRVRAVFTTQYQIYNDMKLHSIPLGIQSDDHGNEILKRLKQYPHHQLRPRLAVAHINPQNEDIFRGLAVFQEQGYDVENFYGKNEDSYFDGMLQSKFILSSRGTNFDAFQHWEALFLGCIPVIEHFNRTMRNRWINTFDDLPVAWIDSYDNLTPQWLKQEHQKIVQNADKYKWEKLTKHWWIAFVKSFVPE